MADRFSKGALTVLLGQAALAAAAIAFSPKIRAAARPFVVAGLQHALALGQEFKDMVDEARLEATGLSKGAAESVVEREAVGAR
jgi:hypothetical protein